MAFAMVGGACDSRGGRMPCDSKCRDSSEIAQLALGGYMGGCLSSCLCWCSAKCKRA